MPTHAYAIILISLPPITQMMDTMSTDHEWTSTNYKMRIKIAINSDQLIYIIIS